MGAIHRADSSSRHLVPERWWEAAPALKSATLKRGRRCGHEISIEPVKVAEQLDEIRVQGFQAVEVFALAEGSYAYSGLDTTNNYRIDPELGTMDDFRRLVRIAHYKTWVLKTRQLHPALHPLGKRGNLPTRADDKHYAFLCTAVEGSERVLVVLNFQPEPQIVEVDLSGVAAAGLVELRYGESFERRGLFELELPAYGYRF